MTRKLWDSTTAPLFELTSGSNRDILDGHKPVVVAEFGENSGAQDAFGRLRVANPQTLFDSKATHKDNSLLWFSKITDVSGNAASTWKPNESAVVLTVDASDTIIRQSKQYIPYQPGKSQLIFQTFVGASPQANVSQKYGLFDAENGLLFEASANNLRMIQRSFVSGEAVETVIEQADWNLDTLDGSGQSGYELDITKSQILCIDFEWLGVGKTRMGFVIDGKFIYAHQFLNTNNLSSVYMSTPDLPIRYEIAGNSDLAAPVSLSTICAMVASEGGVQDSDAEIFSVGRGSSLITVGTDKITCFSIRPKATFNGKTNRTYVDLGRVGLFSEDGPCSYEIVWGGSVQGALWTDVDTDYSSMEYDMTGSDISGGIVIDNGYVSAAKTTGGTDFKITNQRLPLALDIDGNHPSSPLSDILSVTAIRIGATNTDVSVHMNWKERS